MSSRSIFTASVLALASVAACGTPAESDGADSVSTGGGVGSGGVGSDSDGSTDAGSSGGNGSDGTDAGSGGNATGSGGDSAATGGSNGAGGSDGSGGGAAAGGGNGSGGGAPVGDPVPSAGCDAPDAPTGGLRTIDVDGTEREYILTLPDDYDAAHPYRLIFGFHGAMYDAEWVANGEEPLTGPYFGLEAEAAGSAIFVATQANPSWSNTNGQDLAYVEAMLASLEAELCIDTSRVFSVGFSAGGIMTVRIGCAFGDVFRAIAPMSPNLPSDCEDGSEPIAYWSSHGLSDTTITPEQGAAARAEFLERNGCSETTVPASPEGCVSYEGCDEGNPVGYCTFEGAHVPAPFAGAAIWAFFEQF